MYPVQPSVVDHDIRILVQEKKGREGSHPILEAPTDENPALAGEVTAQQDVDVVKVPCEEQFAREPAHAYAVSPVVEAVNIVLSFRIVELGRARFDDDV